MRGTISSKINKNATVTRPLPPARRCWEGLTTVHEGAAAPVHKEVRVAAANGYPEMELAP